VAEAGRRSISRRDLARHENFEQVSPEVGELDEAALDEAMSRDPDEALALLADLTGATDPALRILARRLAGRLMLEVARRGTASRRGTGRMALKPFAPEEGDLDIDASIDALGAARSGLPVDPEGLRVRGWNRPGTALCLVLDRSGSMGGAPLAASAVAAAAVASRAPGDYSVVVFGREVVVVKSQDVPKDSERVVTDVLALRGHGTTDLAGALSEAARQLSRSRAARRITLVLSDCRATVEGDPVAAAALLDEVVVVAPASDRDEADEFARRTGARLVTVDGPASVPEAISTALRD
jgi:Mg-chelatase subunit ChlD